MDGSTLAIKNKDIEETIRFLSLLRFLKELEKRGIKFDFTFQNDRFKLQSIVYIAKFFGIDLGYNFDLYLQTPYSEELAKHYLFIRKIRNSKKDFNIYDIEHIT